MKQMENLYSKLYDKYSKLKSKKESEIDRKSRDQEAKFLDFSTAAGELIDYLRSENSRLQTQINDLTKEVASTRYDKEEKLLEYEELLNEGTRKTKELSEELERVLQQQQLSCSTMNGNDSQLDSPGGTYTHIRRSDMLNESSRKRPSIKCVADQTDEARANPYKSGRVEHAMGTEKEGDSFGDMLSDRDGNFQQGNCCGSNTSVSGAADANCLYQTLVECIVGMKFNLSNKEGKCLSALHQSSGYSFSLTWISKAAVPGEEASAELLYQVTSLGTFERVAPEWMKEDLMFSTSMCPVFFKRLSLVIGPRL